MLLAALVEGAESAPELLCLRSASWLRNSRNSFSASHNFFCNCSITSLSLILATGAGTETGAGSGAWVGSGAGASGAGSSAT